MIDLTKLETGQYFEIKMLSIGGLGAYTTGQMLGMEISKISSLKTSVFASYSSEKKGAPVNVFLRAVKQDKPIRNYGAVTTPNLLVAFKEALLNDQKNLNGLDEDSIILINSDKSIEQLQQLYKLNTKNIFVVDADSIGIKHNVKTNTIMFGAIHKVLSFLDPHISKQTISDKLSFRYEHLVEGNINAFFDGFEQCQYYEITPQSLDDEAHQVLGIEDQLPGGYIIGANSFIVDRSIGREGFKPKFDQSTCINCTKCDLTCPDDCFIWEEVEGRRGRMEMQLVGIDYQYCKGCMRCVTVCPTGSLTKVNEREETISVKKGYQLMED